MPQTIDTSGSPYFDDFSEEKRFHEVIFKPTVAVQNRELIAIQRIFQNQIERMGNNLFKNGTIIEGVNFNFYDNYPYVKIRDVQVNNELAIPANYVGMFVKNNNGLQAHIIDYADGFEATDPDLKTIFVKYINSGNDFNTTAFSSGEILTIYDGNNVISSITINSEGSGYSNTDPLVFTPVLLANVTSGSFNVGDSITDTVTGANGVITALADETIRAPIVNLPGTVSVSTSSKTVTGTNTLFTSFFANGDYIALYSNSSSYLLKQINVVANDTSLTITTNAAFTNSAVNYANTTDSRVYITYRPVDSVLSSSSANTSDWSFTTNSTIKGISNSNLADIVEILGENAAGSIVTDSAGRIIETDITNVGSGYTQTPYVSVKSTTGASANLVALNYYAQVTVSSLVAPVGTGYAFGVSSGIIYQKGFFIRVEPQTIVVDKYSNVPDGITVGFDTVEEIINSNIDTSLLDNSTGYNNFNAPGADRLKLTANLVVTTVNAASANVQFFDLVEWSNGYPYKQNSRTFYNVINDQLSDRTSDTSGDYVVDRFLTTTTSPSNSQLEANTFTVVVDPGTAYVNGYKVQTYYNFSEEIDKVITTKLANNAKVSINYENYLRVDDLGGFFEFDRANVVDLYDTAKNFLSNTALLTSGNTSPVGNKIGTARIRNFVLEQGTPGTPSAIYRMYLFNISMNSGKNFQSVQSVYANSTTNKGIADVVQEYNATANAFLATLHGQNDNKLVFYSGFNSPLNSNNIDYSYRTIDDTQGIANTGVIQVSISGSPDKVFPYTGTLSDAQKLDLYVVPLANLYYSSNLTGTVNVTSSSNVITGNSTDFIGQLKTGQYISINGGTSNNIIKRIVAISNSTSLQIDSNAGFTTANLGFKIAWPAYSPIPLSYNSAISANVDGTGTILSINLGSTLNVASNTSVVVGYNVENQDASPSTKTPNRNMLVKLRLANNAATNVGPWCLGVPDIFRLRGVYKGDSSVSTSSTDVTSEFYIDNGQKGNYYGLGYLYKKQTSGIYLSTDDYLLVEFDCFTASPGFFNVTSYVSSNVSTRFTEDSKPLANLNTTINTLEIPELYDTDGTYFDLINSIDFRPYVDSTANITSNTSAVTLNPSNTISFSSTDRFFPVPDSIFVHDTEYFTSRIDSVVLDNNRNINILNGSPNSNTPVIIPTGTMRLNNLYVPPYPSIPAQLSNNMLEILNTGIYTSGRFSTVRLNNKKIVPLFSDLDFDLDQPLRYTMQDIGSIDRRLKAVEYYIAFDLLQKSIVNKTIPSAISPNINRFKYGFFVDDYSNTAFSDISSPEYNASIIDDFALPRVTSFNMVHLGANTSQPYTSVKLLSQDSATTANVPPPPPVKTDYQGTITIVPPQFKTQSFTITTTSSAGSTTTSTSTSTPTTTSSGGKIVCTAMNEAYGFGSFRNAIWIDYSRNMSKEHEFGYHKLFLPLVNYVYRSEHKDDWHSKLIKKVGERVARKRTADLWLLKKGKMDLEGRLYRIILEPICYIVGKFINK